jgi:uncharacterized protein with von Willebrand factor type A (vWA) domain
MTEPTKPTVTHVLMVIDMSGSMGDLAGDVRGGFNAYLDQLAADGNEYRLTVTMFDTEFIPHAVDRPLTQVAHLDEHNYNPRGMTALYDAIGKTLGEFQAKHGTVLDNERAMLVVQTDGHENSSREFTKHNVRKLIDDREATGRWMCIYMGAGPKAWDEGHGLGMSHSVGTTQDAGGTRARYRGLATASGLYAGGASRGETFTVVVSEPGVVDEAP